MKNRQKILVCLFSTLAILLIPMMSFGQVMRDFPIPDGLVTDFSGTLSSEDKTQIMDALERARVSNGMDGHVVIVLSTDEWYTQEYVKDYADYLQGQGVIGSTGWLMYVSTADRKFGIGVQDLATESITKDRREEIYLKMSLKLETGDVVGGVMEGIGAIERLDPPSAVKKSNENSANMFVLMGILIIVVALMFRLRKTISKKA